MRCLWSPAVEMHVDACRRDGRGRLGAAAAGPAGPAMATGTPMFNPQHHSADGQHVLLDFVSLAELDQQVRRDDKRFEEMLHWRRDGEGLSDGNVCILAQRTLGNPPW